MKSRLLSFQALALIILVVMVSRGAHAQSLKQLSDAAFQELDEIISAFEKTNTSKAIAGEIAVARRYVTHGKLLLRAGRTKNAAILAERLQFEVELIRAMVATAEAASALQRTEEENLELTRRLKRLRDRLDRLQLQADGATATGAFPAASGGR